VLLSRIRGPRLALVPVVLLVAGHLSFAAHFFKEIVVVATLPATQRWQAASRRLAAVIPAGATVVTKDLWWLIAERNPVYEPMFSRPPENAVDFVALTGNGSGVPGKSTG